MSFHGDEDWLDMNGLLTNENTEKYKDDIKELLSKYYKWDEECEEFEDEHPDTYHKYEIRAEFEDECCDDTYKTILHIEVWLPTDEDAKELADILDGTVVSGLNADGKEFCITYTKKIVIKAKNKAEAKKLFDEMNMQYADSLADFGKISSIVGKTEKKTKKSKK
ncbi:MAG: hypothetical protein J6Q22_16685 [Prevotella sp.]|nr:hypothetical protein [Prevotella sp.]